MSIKSLLKRKKEQPKKGKRPLLIASLTVLCLVLSGLLLISVAANVIFYRYDVFYLKKTIQELNRGAEIDYEYTNTLDDYMDEFEGIYKSCNTMLARELRGDVPDQELTDWLEGYTQQTEDASQLISRIEELKKQRSEEFAQFKYAKVYKPDAAN